MFKRPSCCRHVVATQEARVALGKTTGLHVKNRLVIHTCMHRGPTSSFVLVSSPPRAFFRLNHVRNVRKRCSHSSFSFQAIILGIFWLKCRLVGVSNGPIQFKSALKIRLAKFVLAKFLLLLAYSDSRSNSCMANLSTLGKNALVMHASGNMHPGSVCCRFIETEARSNSFRKAPAK